MSKNLAMKVIFSLFALFILFGAMWFNSHPQELYDFGLTMFISGVAFTFVSLMAVVE